MTGLPDSLLALALLTADQGQQGLPESLIKIAELATRTIPGAEGVGVTLLEAGQPDVIVASTDFVREIDAVQYALGEGPCITAAAEGHTVHSDELGEDRQWPSFGPRIKNLGVHSVLSLPLQRDNYLFGAMNVYAHPRFAFTAAAIDIGERFAAPAAASVQNAHTLDRIRRLARPLHTAVSQLSVIDQAAGMIMDRRHCSHPEALTLLRGMSEARGLSVHSVARLVLDRRISPSKTDGTS